MVKKKKKKSVMQVSERYKDKISLAISGLHKSPKERFLKENKESGTELLSKVNAGGKPASVVSPENVSLEGTANSAFLQCTGYSY